MREPGAKQSSTRPSKQRFPKQRFPKQRFPKQLFRKEWRENRLVPAWFAALVGLIIVACHTVEKNHDPQEALVIMLIGCMGAAVFAGSGLISREVGNSTLQFLMSQPVRRSQVWWIKFTAGLGVLAVSVAAILLTGAVCQWTFFGPPGFSAFVKMGWPIDAPAALLGIVGCYTVALLVSTLLDRSISAAMVGIAACIVLLIPISVVTEAFALCGGSENTGLFMGVMAGLCAPAFLLASYVAFTRGESLRTPRRFWLAGAACLAGLLAAWTPAMAGYSWLTRFHASGNRTQQIALSPDGSMIAIRALQGWTGVGQNDTGALEDHLVVEQSSGGGAHVLPGGEVIAWSPDGRWLLYNRSVGPLGLHYMNGGSLTLVDCETGALCPVAPLPYVSVKAAVWSPDSRQFAVQDSSGGVGIYERSQAGPAPLHPRHTLQLENDWRQGESTISTAGVNTCSAIPAIIGWGSDSRTLYVTQFASGRYRLLAIDPARLPEPVRLYSFGIPTDNSVDIPGICPVFYVPQGAVFNLCLTADPHRTLVVTSTEILPLLDHPGPVRLENQRSYVVDLVAATEAARQRPAAACANIAAPANWRRLVLGPLAGGANQESASLSPDGRYLVTVLSSGFTPSAAAYAVDLDSPLIKKDGRFIIDAPPWKILAGVTSSPASEQWLPGGHQFYARVEGSPFTPHRVTQGRHQLYTSRPDKMIRQYTYQCFDAATGRHRMIPLATASHPTGPLVLGGQRPDRLLLSSHSPIQDLFHPAGRAITL